MQEVTVKEKGVHALLVDTSGRVAVVKKSLKYTYAPQNAGKVSMFGGKQELGEKDTQTLTRELQEELGISLSETSFSKLCTFQKIKKTDGVDGEVAVYIVPITELLALSLAKEEHTSGALDSNEQIVIDTCERLLYTHDLTRITRLSLQTYQSTLQSETSPNQNVAYIDGQNMYMGVTQGDRAWDIDLTRFRAYLRKKYNVSQAFYFLGFSLEGVSAQKLYEEIQAAGFILTFKKHTAVMAAKKKGNVDSDIIFHAMRVVHEPNFTGKVVLVSGDGDYRNLVDFLLDRRQFMKLLFPNRQFVSSLYKKLGSEYLSCLGDVGVKNKIEAKEKGSLGS